VKRSSIFPLSARAFTFALFGVLTCAFVLFFFLTSPPGEFKYVRTEIAKVTAIQTPTDPKAYQANAIAHVQLQNGAKVQVPFQTRQVILVGQNIRVDVLEGNGEKRRYRLAQEPVQP
jgi:hypothetical protein